MRNPSRRSAYTLFEVVLVAAVITILGGVAYPSLKNMYGYHKQNGAVDSVRAAWAQARASAIDEGRAYRFSVEPGGSHFRVAPDQDEFWSGGSSDSHDKVMILEKALPAGVRFSVDGDSSSSAPAPAPVASENAKDDKPSGKWTTGVVFLPDGTAKEDVKITFQVQGVRPTAIQLRGMTGNVTVETAKP